MVDDVKRIVDCTIYSDLVDRDLACESLRDCVSESDVLQTEICHIEDISCLRIEVVAACLENA